MIREALDRFVTEQRQFALLRRRYDAEMNEALQQQVTGDGPGIPQLERLQRLAELLEVADRPRRRNRTLMLVAVLCLAIGALTVFNTASVDILLDSVSQDIRTRNSGPTRGLKLRSIQTLDVGKLRWIRGTTWNHKNIDQSVGSIRVTTLHHRDGSGEITLDNVELKQGALLLLGVLDELEFRLDVRDDTASLAEITVHGPAAIEFRSADSTYTVPAGMDEYLTVYGGTDGLTAQFGIASSGALEIEGHDLQVNELSFLSAKQFSESPEPRSSVSSGTLRFPSLDRQAYDLLRGQWLEIDHPDGVLRDLSISTLGLRTTFEGNAGDVKLGSRRSVRSLKPSPAEALYAEHGLKLFWTVLIGSGSLVLAILRWWSTSR